MTRVVMAFKDQQDSAKIVKTQLKDLSLFKLRTTIQPVLVSKKIGQDLH